MLPLFLLWVSGIGFAQSYNELAGKLGSANGKVEIHRLKAQVAEAAIQRLETQKLAASARKKLKAEVVAYCSDVQLGLMDVWYGSSVVTWSRLLLLDGDWRGARSMLWDQAEVLQNIEHNLAAAKLPVSALSPVAGCRYFLGETYRIEYEETGELEPATEALRHFYNVYVKYGDSPWGGLAGEKAEEAKAFVESLGKQVRVDLGKHRATFVANQFRFGARLAAQGRNAEAVDRYLAALNAFPKAGKAVDALRNLGICWIELERCEETLVVAEYLCEQFLADTNAPAAVLAIGRRFLEQDEPSADWVFEKYLATFPNDPHRVDILSHFAWKAYKAKNLDEAATRFQILEAALRVAGETGDPLEKAVYIQADCSKNPADYDRFVAEFPSSELAPRSLGEKAQALLVADRFEAAFQTLETLSERYPEASVGKLQAVYLSSGEALLADGKFAVAQRAFSAISPPTDPSFYGLAAAQFGQGHFAECFQTLEKLLSHFPAAGSFRGARLMQARALEKLGRTDEAIGAYREVLATKHNYAVAFELAQILPDPEERLAAYQRIALLADPSEEANLPLIADSLLASLPLGLELEKHALVLDTCDQFQKQFPNHEKVPTLGTFRKEASDALEL